MSPDEPAPPDSVFATVRAAAIKTALARGSVHGGSVKVEFPSEFALLPLTGCAGTLALEEVCRTARRLGELPALSELLGGSKPTR